MMMHDCRRDESYNQKYLDDKDTEFLNGFDWAVEQAIDNFFNNEMGGLEDEDAYLGHILCERLPKSMQEEYTMEFASRDDEERKCVSYADLVRMEILTWAEGIRNELITSMLDNYGEEKYEKIKALVDGQSKAEN